ncbi:uracil-DNA glycosylase family protein [Beijerinckia sp. L45]|uniref:uracil-DNA glycosylase family protein n=1 Tax=Beijerinckia sp. L45 TaxID=1641855 RepID=UPI00131DCE69|nr:uracil-DNA glycosylase family protein [Beijerinckia sp. L45]
MKRTDAGELEGLVSAIRGCRLCRDAPVYQPPLPQEPNPILRIDRRARLLIASQAPGIRAHNSSLPFDDPSGERLRAWMGLDRPRFYDASKVLIGPMGFCFPGHTADKGDLPPRRECAALWHDRLFAAMPQVELILAIGRYAQLYHFRRLGRPLPPALKLDDLVRRWPDFAGSGPTVIALPHPSWRNSGWINRNPWFETDVLPAVREAVAAATRDAVDTPVPTSAKGRS